MVLFGQLCSRARARGVRVKPFWRAWFRRFRVESRRRGVVVIGAVGLCGRAGFRGAAGAWSPATPPKANSRPRRRSISRATRRKGSTPAAIFRANGGEGFSFQGARRSDREALQANPSLQAAQVAPRQAKENLTPRKARSMPSLDANASATRQQFSPAESGQPGRRSIFNLFQTTLNISLYTPTRSAVSAA